MKFKAANYFNFIFCVFLLVVSGCQKQKAPSVGVDSRQRVVGLDRTAACAETNFSQDLLNHANLKNFFLCNEWNEKYPNLLGSILEIESTQWDHLFSFIDLNLFNDPIIRERIFGHIKELDQKDGLDDFSEVLKTLFDLNFFNALRDLSLCAEGGDCKKTNPLSLKEVKDLLNFLNFSQEDFSALITFSAGLKKGLDENNEIVKRNINELVANKSFLTERISLISSLANIYGKNWSEKKRLFYKGLFAGQEKNSKLPWIVAWIKKQMQNGGTKNFFNKYLIEYPEMLNGTRVLFERQQEMLSCQGGEAGTNISIDLGTVVDRYIGILSEKNHQDFYRFAQEGALQELTAETYCPSFNYFEQEIALYQKPETIKKVKVNFKEYLKEISALFQNEAHYNLFQFISKLSFENKDREALAFFAGDLTGSLSRLALIWFNVNEENFSVLEKVVFDTNGKSFQALGYFVEKAMTEKNDSFFQSLSKYWFFLNTGEKEFYYSFLDKHFDSEIDFVKLFTFYEDMGKEFINILPQVKNSLLRDESIKNKTYQSVSSMVKKFSGKKVLEELRDFFSRDQIIAILDILAEGKQIRNGAKDELNSYYVDQYITDTKKIEYELSNLTGEAKDEIECFNDLIKNDKIYSLFLNFPPSCTRLEEKNAQLKLYSWVSEFNSSHKEEYSKDIGLNFPKEESFFDELGLFSPASLSSLVANLKVLNGKNSLFETFVSKAHEHLFLRGQLGNVEQGVLFLSDFFSFDKLKNQTIRNKFLSNTLKNKREVKDLVVGFSKNLVDYNNWKKTYTSVVLNQKESLKCSNFQNENIGGFVCPEPVHAKTIVRKILKDVRSQYDVGGKTFIELAVDLVGADRGLMIPYKAEDQELFILKPSRMLEMVFDLTNKKSTVNQESFEYRLSTENDFEDLFNREIDYSINPINPDVIAPGEKRYTPLKNKTEQLMTMMEQVEVVLRDIRFDNVYMGGFFMNTVSRSSKYVKKVKDNYSALKLGGKIHFGREDKMLKNTIESYPSLWKLNQDNFSYGKEIQGILTATVSSSSESSSKIVSLVKTLKKGKFKKHNAKIISNFAMVGGMSNLGRWVQDRIGNTKQELNNFFQTKQYKTIESEIMTNLDDPLLGFYLNEIIRKLETTKNNKGELLTDKLIDWLAQLSYSQTRTFEKTVGRLLYIYSSLDEDGDYKSLRLMNIIPHLTKLVNIWPSIEKSLSDNFKFIDYLSSVDKIVSFVESQFLRNNKITISLVNNFAKMGARYLFDDVNGSKGIDLLAEYLNLNSKKSFKQIGDFFNYLDSWTEKEKEIFALELHKFVNNEHSGAEAFLSYIQHTSRPFKCLGNANCTANIHYDEIAFIFSYLAQPNSGNTKETRFTSLMRTLFQENRGELSELMDRIFSHLNIEKK